jgi:choline-sulfatase
MSADLAGIPVPEGLDSRSLRPLLEGRETPWNNEAVSQFGKQNLMIKRDHLKYQYYGPDQPEVLWDLQADPGERHNCLGDPAYAPAVGAFRRRLAELGHGPDAVSPYRNAGYQPGCPTDAAAGMA